MDSRLLRYSINDWHQLTQCLSNTDKLLKIHVTDIFDIPHLSGTLIQVTHLRYGVLFASLVSAHGTCVLRSDGVEPNDLPRESILSELHKFGFLVKFENRHVLSAEQVSFLQSCKALGFTRLRWLAVRGDAEPKLVAFNVEKLPKWLNNTYAETESAYLSALDDGVAINVSSVGDSKKYDWTWLDYVADIPSVLAENTGRGGAQC